MSDLFGKLKNTVDKGAKIITTKSSSLIDENKLKLEINSLKKKKNDLLIEIGTRVYEAHPLNFSIDQLADELTEVNSIDNEIALLEKEIEHIKKEVEDKMNDLNKQ
ncbi:MAG: hypothetical protein K8R73_10645 [Clostridiales bacterium]|nr:hypothetical protein [Clostridiales bacterium]